MNRCLKAKNKNIKQIMFREDTGGRGKVKKRGKRWVSVVDVHSIQE
jgi:hypothetical protein